MAKNGEGTLGWLRERNRNRVLGALRERGRISQADIARLTGLSRTTVHTLVSELKSSGLVHEVETSAPDDLDWDDEIRIALEERASMSPDALTGLEANLRFGGTETMETRIFGRLSAWQNWIFIRPNAVGEHGALKVYGSGAKAKFNWERV